LAKAGSKMSVRAIPKGVGEDKSSTIGLDEEI
jgi:hypothetical protein